MSAPGGVSALGGCLLGVGVSGPRGVCSREGGICSREGGVCSREGGVCSRGVCSGGVCLLQGRGMCLVLVGCLLWGVSAPGGVSGPWGVSGAGEGHLLQGGGIPACTEVDTPTPLWTDRRL